MRRYRVSDSTVLRSLEDLQRAGWIVRKRGSGTFAADPRERIAVSNGKISAAPTQSPTVVLIARTSFTASYLRLCADLLTRQAEAQGLSLVCRVNSPAFASADLSVLQSTNPRGFVFLGYMMADTAAQLVEHGHRAVVIGTPPAETRVCVPTVCADHDLGGYLAAQHLIDAGHRRIAFAYDGQLPGPPENHPRWIGHKRALDGVSKNGTKQHAVIDPQTLALWRTDADAAAAYFDRPNAPTAVAAWNDSVAMMLLGILHRAKKRVPDAISVIGFDAVPEGIDGVPALSTVDQHMDWQVQTALRLLSRPEPPAPQLIMVLPELISRASVAAPPKGTLFPPV